MSIGTRESGGGLEGLDTVTAYAPIRPIRRIDGLEVPTTGTWTVVGASTVVRSTGWRRLRALPVLTGWVEIGEDPADSSLRLALVDSALFATTAGISLDRYGRPEWLLEGFAESAGRNDPLTLCMSYRGLFRRGVDVLAWLSGTGSIGCRGDRLVVELLLTTPRPTFA